MLSADLSKCRERIVKASDISGKITAFIALEPTVAKTVFNGLPSNTRKDINDALRHVLETSTLPIEILNQLKDQDSIIQQTCDRLKLFFGKRVFH
ncbi:MAG TPA: hypothetical protein PKD34_00990 [Candidatus Doudnabacteria bacterium]|nr:hypothetical protein [Candidatus Doudnabacteria bacterium]